MSTVRHGSRFSYCVSPSYDASAFCSPTDIVPRVGIQTATFSILIRTVARIISLVGGLGGSLEQNEVVFLVLDGGLVLLAGILLTIIPAGKAFGSAWMDTSPFSSRNNHHSGSLPQRYTHRRMASSHMVQLHPHESRPLAAFTTPVPSPGPQVLTRAPWEVPPGEIPRVYADIRTTRSPTPRRNQRSHSNMVDIENLW